MELQRAASAVIAITFLMAPIQAVHAEYYLIYPEPAITQFFEYKSPSMHKHKKHTVHRAKVSACAPVHKRHVQKSRSHYSIEVSYVWPVCPGCACSNTMPYCYPNDEQLNRQAVSGSGSYVTFHAKPTQYKRHYTKSDETFDMRTSDDDVMHYPDMNNQY